MKPSRVRHRRPMPLEKLDRIWEQACDEAREVRAQRQRAEEAMRKAGEPDRFARAEVTS